MELHVLHRHGWSIRALAREFGLSRRTARRNPTQVVSRCYERGSIVLTSNRGFADWGGVFADQVVDPTSSDRP